MKIVLFAPGVEDARSPAWGHMVPSLEALGHEVVPVDVSGMTTFLVRKTVRDQWMWVLDTYQPDIVFIVPDDEAVELEIAAETSRRNIRTEMIDVAEVSRYHLDSAHRVLGGVFLRSPEPWSVPEPVRRSHRVTTFADYSPKREALLTELVDAGVDVGVYGEGWRDVASLRSRSFGPIPHASIGAVLRESDAALVLPVLDHPARSIGSVQLALEATLAGVPVLALQAPQLEGVIDHHAAASVGEVVRLLEEPLVPSRRRVEHEWHTFWAGLLGPSPSFRVSVTKEGPKVSFVTATYNLEPYIGLAIESLLAQTEQDFEILVTNDGSSDGSAAAVAKYLSDPRVRYVEQDNIGQTGRIDWVFRRITAMARGQFIAMLGGDDIAFPDRTERQLEIFDEDEGADVVHTGGIAIDGHGTEGQKLWAIEESYDTSSLLRRHVLSNAIASPTFMARRSFFDEAGNWTSGFSCDYHFWMMAARTMRCRFLPAATTGYRTHATNSSLGAGATTAQRQGTLVRGAHTSRSTMVDLYPALQWLENDEQAWLAAYVDLSTRYIAHLPNADSALEIIDFVKRNFVDVPDDVAYNEAIAYALKGDVVLAQTILDRIQTGVRVDDLTLGHLVQGPAISAKPFQLPLEVARTAAVWDGTFASQTRLLLIPDWEQPSSLTSFISGYLRKFNRDDDVDLVLPTAGVAVPDVLERLGRALPGGVDAPDAATVTVERWDDLDFLPADRFAVVGNVMAADGVTGWEGRLQAAKFDVHPRAR